MTDSRPDDPTVVQPAVPGLYRPTFDQGSEAPTAHQAAVPPAPVADQLRPAPPLPPEEGTVKRRRLWPVGVGAGLLLILGGAYVTGYLTSGDVVPRTASVGRHLLLEKPVALSSDDARLVADTAAAAGVVTQLMLTRRYGPVTREFLVRIRDLTVDGVSGQYSHGAFLGGPFATPWRLTEGVLLDLGPHLLDLLEQVAGPFVSVCARRNRHDAVAIAGLHAEGALSSVLLSGRAGGPGIQRLVAFGESGSLTYDPGELDESVCFRIAFDEFLSAVHHGTPVVADARRGDDLQRLLGACLESIGTGASVDV